MRAGAVIDRFEIVAAVGSGSSSSVYRARDTTTGALVAIKVLDRQQPFDIARFAREATLLASIHHPNIVGYVAHGEVDGTHYLVQSWVDGSTLAGRLGIGITARTAVAIALGVAEAAAATHAVDIVHRDIKPSNILLEGDPPTVKLVDFGIARLASEAGILTRTGTMIGTPAYMAPEQARGEVSIGPAADVWAIGCMLHEMLTGRAPFTGRTPEAIRAKVLLDTPPSLSSLCPEAPPALVALVGEMLSKDPAERPRDGAAVAARLRALPPIPDGPARSTVRREMPPTQVLGTNEIVRSFVMVAPPEDVDPSACIGRVATRFELEVHTFEDATVLLIERQAGAAGALRAAQVAVELRREIAASAVSVFGQSSLESLENAIERGASLLARAKISALFEDDDAIVRMDPTIAAVFESAPPELASGLVIAPTPEGPVLRAAR